MSNHSKGSTQNMLEGNWKQLKGRVQQAWGELTNDDVDRINGSRTELAGILQEKYGKAQHEVEKEIDEFLAKNS
ncbi:MAG: CsbD family protein [Anaerolineales bacterium]|nr:CsbD family protein [Anaerolineales bacterium]